MTETGASLPDRPRARTRLDELVAESARRSPDAPALSFDEATLTYAELADEIERFSRALRHAGIGGGDRVAVYLDKRIETVVAMFGAAAAGAAFVPVNPLLRAAQVRHIAANCEVRVLVTTIERWRLLEDDLADNDSLELVIVVGELAEPPADRTRRFAEWRSFSGGEAPLDQRAGIDLDLAAIFYTSGSTGLPKGVVLSHRNLVAGAESVAEYLANTADDRILAVLPLSFDAGFSQLTTAFAAGAHAILANYRLPRDVVGLCARHRITGLTGVPPLWIQLIEQQWPPEATEQMRYFANTGGRMPRSTLDRLRQIFTSADPYLMYGLTEAFRSTYLDPREVDRRPDSIGKAIPNAEVMVVREDGSRCEPGEHGELVHRGALVSLGYWNDEAATAERFRPAPGRDPALQVPEVAVWSGDLVVADEEGFLYFVGRADEMIKTSGYRVSPAEVEEAAYETGLVRDAVALGIEDPRLGQRIVLIVSPEGEIEKFEAEGLTAALRKRLPLYMVPRQIEVLDALPRSPNGKFDRQAIRDGLQAR